MVELLLLVLSLTLFTPLGVSEYFHIADNLGFRKKNCVFRSFEHNFRVNGQEDDLSGLVYALVFMGTLGKPVVSVVISCWLGSQFCISFSFVC